MQLVAYGAQDIYLTGNPMITYFKVVYRRHTNFAMESIAQTFNGSVGYGNRVSALISRNGDLISGMHLEVNIPAPDANVTYRHNPGHLLVQQVEVEIGGQLIDRQYSDWLEIWSQLTVTASKKLGYLQMIGQSLLAADGTVAGAQAAGRGERRMFIPLQFWFCRNVGLALPLIALQYHEVKVNLTIAPAATIVSNGTPVTPNVTLWVDYIYLDTDERRRFAQVSHEYLIEQLQFSGDEAVTAAGGKSINLNFNHPVKELVWVWKPAAAVTSGAFQFTNTALGNGVDNFANAMTGGASFGTAQLQLNGQDRFASRDGAYFNKVQTYRHHTCIPDSPGIYVYSFALKPEEHQPSGTCNFSRIDNAKLTLTGVPAAGAVKVFAVNYNVLRVMSGMGGLAYSN